MKSNSNAPIVIRRGDDHDDHGHHGGGWKVAYADFMTAMMAFFLLLWIVAASDEEKLRGLADYFTPSLSSAGGKGDGVLAGQVMGPDGTMSGTDGPKSEVQLPSFGQENPLAVFDSRLRDEAPKVVVEYETRLEEAVPNSPPPEPRSPEEIAEDPTAQLSTVPAETPTERRLREAAEKQAEDRRAEMEELKADILSGLEGNAELQAFMNNLRFEVTDDGLLIEIIDQEGHSMFASGSARIEADTREVLAVVGRAIMDLPNGIVLEGHTDAVPFSRPGYSNWELSSDRANASRRVLQSLGIRPERFLRISGLAATDPLDPDNPTAPQNRRISVLLRYPE